MDFGFIWQQPPDLQNHFVRTSKVSSPLLTLKASFGITVSLLLIWSYKIFIKTNIVIFLNQCLQLSLETLDLVFPLNNISRRTSSIPKFHRLFGHEDLTQVKSLPSLSKLEVANKRTSSHSWNGITTIRHPSLMSLFSFHSKSSEEGTHILICFIVCWLLLTLDKRKMMDDLMLDEASCFC